MTGLEAFLVVCVAVLSGTFGAGVSVALLALSKYGEATRFDTLLLPLREGMEDLADRIDHVRKRAYKRDRDEHKESHPELPISPTSIGGRKARLEAVKERLRAHGIPAQDQESG